MSHLFFIHSHTLFLTALGVVDYLHLPKADVLFVYSRHYRSAISVEIKSIDLSKEIEETFYIMLSWSRRNFLFNRERRDKSVEFFDRFVSERAGREGFCLYIPHLQLHAFQILATNPLCKDVFFIQEGGRPMPPLQTGKISLLNRVYNTLVLRNDKRVWKCSNWFPNEHTPYSRSVSVFAFNPTYFGNAPEKVFTVTWPKINLDIRIDSKRPMFLLEGAVELGQIDRNTYMTATEQLIREFAGDRNYIKFHPMQSGETKQEFIEIFKKLGKDVEELPMDVPFELIVSNFKNLKLYGFGTSLLFYGKAFGHQVVSRERLLMKSRRYRIYCKGLEKIDV